MLDKSKKVCYNIKAVRDDTPLKLNNPCAEVVEWQTRYFEGVVEIFPCGFKSHSPHHLNTLSTFEPLGSGQLIGFLISP